MKVLVGFLSFCALWKFTMNLNCEEIKKYESAARFPAEELNTLTEEDLNNCFSLLGKEKLTIEQAETLWQLVLKSRGPAEEIPEEDLRLLGWIARGIPPGQFLNMSFTDIDTIAAFGRYYDLSYDQLSALRDAVMDQWSNKDITDLSCFDLANLGHILCAFNATDIERIHSDSYKDAASELSLLKNCSGDVLKSLANLATSPKGFGEPSKWTALEVSSVGCVLAGVTVISSIPSEAFKGISPDIVECLPKSVFQSMSETQLKLMPVTSGKMLGDMPLRRQVADREKAVSGPTSSSSTLDGGHKFYVAALIPVSSILCVGRLIK